MSQMVGDTFLLVEIVSVLFIDSGNYWTGRVAVIPLFGEILIFHLMISII